MPDPVLISSLSNAIANQEGYGVDPNNKPTRTNNPGDIGNTTEGGTQSYATPEAGWAALDNQVSKFFAGSNIYNPNMSLTEIGQHYASDPNWAQGVAYQLGVSPDVTLNQLASGQVAYTPVPRTGSGYSSTGQVQSDNTQFYGVDPTQAATSLEPVIGQQVTQQTVDDATPSTIIWSGLSETPWFQDPNILQVNGPTSQVPAPVTFQMSMDQDNAWLPIVIELNASLKQFSRQMKHVMRTTPTLTGLLVTMWGLEVDTITGSGSTGVFMNRLGLTDFPSLSNAPDEVLAMVPTTIDESNFDEGTFRVAAKDAFIELLALFKNNATVWFQNENYTGDTSQLVESGPDMWSPTTGSTVQQNHARRNDVMTRGTVAMNFRNSTYHGYFNALNFTLDAETPFSWNFNFTFKVERTITNVPIPDVS